MISVFLATVLIQPRTLQVQSVEVRSIYAGKRGQRVTETIVAKDEHGSVTLNVIPFHTNVANTRRIASKGDSIRVMILPTESRKTLSVSEIKF